MGGGAAVCDPAQDRRVAQAAGNMELAVLLQEWAVALTYWFLPASVHLVDACDKYHPVEGYIGYT